MKAFLAQSYGGPEVMRIGDIADPVAGRGEVLVTVRATSVNPVDWKVREGAVRILTGRRFPKVYGCDLAGVVHAVGRGVTAFSVGDAVYGFTPIMFGKPGAHAEQVAVAAKRLRRLPVGLAFEHAASLPVAALSALNGLRQCGELTGRTLLLNGATGGVGHFALQIAKAEGAQVTAVCRAAHAARAHALGADRVLDYAARDFARDGVRYDIVFDAFGKLGFAVAARALAPHGFYVTTLGNPELLLRAVWLHLGGGKRIRFANMRAKSEDYALLEQFLQNGQVRPIVEHVFPLQQTADAFATLEAGGTVGKVVIRVGQPG